MEIAPIPRRSAHRRRRRLVLGWVVLAPVALLVLLPAVLGFHYKVVTETGADGAAGRGSLVLTREVPVADLHLGDVVVLPPPGAASGAWAARRVVGFDDGGATTAGARADTGAWRLSEGGSADQVVLSAPWLGYPFLTTRLGLLLAPVAVVAAIALLLVWPTRLPGVRFPHRRRLAG